MNKRQTNEEFVEKNSDNTLNLANNFEQNFSIGEKMFLESYKNLKAIPEYRTVILTCMDCRISPQTFGIFKPGKVIMIKTAGALFTQDVLRSLLIAIFLLQIKFIAVISHIDCGGRMEEKKMIELLNQVAEASHISESDILNLLGKNSASQVFLGFNDEKEQLLKTVEEIKENKLIPDQIEVKGYLYNPFNGKIEEF